MEETPRSGASSTASKKRMLKWRAASASTRESALQSTVVTLARVVTIAYGAYLVIEGDTSVGTVVAFTRDVGGLFGPVQSLAEIEAAARAAMAHDFILGLPNAYQTVVGERGGRLSVGEKQRIAIARALLKDLPIVILDEATSALDAQTEAEVQAALDRLLRGRTAIVIAHRLATFVHTDRIVVLRHGRVEDGGAHGELMPRRGYYAKLVEEQTRGLIAAPPATLQPAALH